MKNCLKYIAALVVSAPLLWGCGNDADIIQTQRNNIVAYLTGSLGLVPEEEVIDEENTDFYSVRGGVYRYIAGNDIYDEIYPDTPFLENGDVFRFYFAAYTFGTAPSSFPFYTNVDSIATATGNSYDWSFDPVETRLGDGDILKSIEGALIECHEGDEVWLFITSDLAYGDRQQGAVPPNTALLYRIAITYINKDNQ